MSVDINKTLDEVLPVHNSHFYVSVLNLILKTTATNNHQSLLVNSLDICSSGGDQYGFFNSQCGYQYL